MGDKAEKRRLAAAREAKPGNYAFPLKLIDLAPQFVRYVVLVEECERHKPDGYEKDPNHRHSDACWEKFTGPCVYHHFVEAIAEAQGVDFLCPLCFIRNQGPCGTHLVCCWSRSRGVPDDAEPGPGRWTLEGASFDDLTLGAEPGQTRSVLLTGDGCKWHGYVTSGVVT